MRRRKSVSSKKTIASVRQAEAGQKAEKIFVPGEKWSRGGEAKSDNDGEIELQKLDFMAVWVRFWKEKRQSCFSESPCVKWEWRVLVVLAGEISYRIFAR